MWVLGSKLCKSAMHLTTESSIAAYLSIFNTHFKIPWCCYVTLPFGTTLYFLSQDYLNCFQVLAVMNVLVCAPGTYVLSVLLGYM